MTSMRDFWIGIKGILRTARQVINAELEPLDLSSAEGDILFHLLTGSNHCQQEQLAERLDIGKAAVSRALDSLEAKEYIIRERQREDKRAYCVSLTDKAHSAGPDIVGIYDKLYARVKTGIADEDFIQIASVLSRVATNLNTLGDK